MVTSETSEGPLPVPDALVRAVVLHAGRQADLTAAYLDASGLYQSKPSRLPAAFLLELAAVLELGLWERQDLRRHIDVSLPTYREAADQLAARCKKGPVAFQGSDAAPLSLQVLHVWTENFAWNGQELLQADVVVGELDEDEFCDLLAEFLWNHRDELAEMLHIEGNK